MVNLHNTGCIVHAQTDREIWTAWRQWAKYLDHIL